MEVWSTPSLPGPGVWALDRAQMTRARQNYPMQNLRPKPGIIRDLAPKPSLSGSIRDLELTQ